MKLPTAHEDDLALIEERAGLGQIRAQVDTELHRLPPGQQTALRLRIIEEYSYPESASRLGLSEQAARARVSRGLRLLTAALEPYLAQQERA